MSTDYGTNAHFQAPLVINIVQCFFCIITGSAYLYIKTLNSKTTKFSASLSNRSIFLLYAISISQSISAPLSYKSLDHVDYILYLLAKSCKLIPVMLVHFVLFKTRYPVHKYIVAGLITAGVAVFTIGGMSKKSTDKEGNILLGISMLTGSLFLDGFMNSAQDVLFKKNKSMTGAHLMTYLNSFTMLNLLAYTIICTNEINDVYHFVVVNGTDVVYDVVKFSICGALGQIFIFITLEKFSSVVLVTVTVTRKMLSMVISVVLFGHVLSFQQWSGLVLVVVGVALESLVKVFKKNTNVKVKTG